MRGTNSLANEIKKKYYPSSAAFMWGRVVFTDYYGSGCLRRILIQQAGVRGKIDRKHAIRGELNERLYEKSLQNSAVPYEREKAIRQEVGGTETILSGRIDFLTDRRGSGAPDTVEELKSTESKSVRSAVIGRGEYKADNLAQLVAYMIQQELVDGRLTHTYYEKDADGEYASPAPKMWRGKEIRSSRTFEVSIDDYGRIYVDGEATRWTVFDQLAHQHAVAHVLETGEVWERPHNYDAVWNSPCQYCDFKATCDKWDTEEISTTEELIQEARKELLSKGDKR